MKEQQKRKFKQIHPEIEDGIDLRRCPPLLELKNHEPVKTKSFCSAGRTTTNEELEDMLEQGNPAVFTQVKNMIIL